MKLHIIKYSLSIVLCSFIINAFGHGAKTPHPENENVVKFTENKKQWQSSVLYRATLDGGALFMEKNSFTYNFYDKETLHKNHIKAAKDLNKKTAPIRFHAFRMNFVGANEYIETESKQVTPDFCNFFIGNDRTKWAGNVKNYREVVYKNLYNGIDLQVLGLQNSIKYNFIVAAGSSTNNIRLNYEGLDRISLEKGALRLKTSVNEMLEQKPYAYQQIGNEKVEVPCEFVLQNNTVTFNFPKGYNKNIELVIDPILVFACSSGSIADNFGMTATYDGEGNLYSGGTVFGAGFPTTLGAFDVTWNGAPTYVNGRTDVVITKYDSSGTFLRYSTYLGGSSSTEIVSSLIVNSQGELMLSGVTGSNDFPVTAGAYDVTFNGGTYLNYAPNGTEYLVGSDLYAAKFDTAGSSLLACTYIGGSLNDGINSSSTLVYNYGDYYRGEIQTDAYGNFYITSCTYSTNFPVTSGVYQSANAGGLDGVVLKMDSNLSSLIWSSYLGGTSDDACYALVVDDSLDVYATGGTGSNNFPVTAGALSTTYGGGITDGFVTKIKNDGSSILNSTYIGTAAYDQSFFIQLDKGENVYILGQTLGVMPVSAGVYSNPNSRQFIWKMNNSLSSQIFTTVFGNGTSAINLSPAAFLVDHCENIYVSGWGGHILLGTPTTGMPLTADAIQPTTDGFNFYLFVLSTNATSLLYATYFGGASSQEHVDGGTSRFDKKGIIYQSVCAGCGGNDDFPVTPGSWPNTGANVNHNTQNNNCNNGVFKFDFQVALADANFTVDYLDGCAPLTVEFQNQSSGGAFLWDFGGGDTTSTIVNPIHTFPNPGIYLVQLTVNNPASCNVVDTAYHYVTVHPSVTADFGITNPPCSNHFEFSDSSQVTPTAWEWDFGDGDVDSVQNPAHDYDSTAVYNVQLIATTIHGCKDTISFPVNFASLAPVAISNNDTICRGTGVTLSATGGYAYSWSPATGLSNPNIANPFASPDSTTTYTVTIQTINAINDTCPQTLTTLVTVIADNAAFTADIAAGCTPFTLTFQNNSAATSVYLWDFGNGDTTSTVFNPTTTYTLPGTYTVYLYAKDPASCGIWDTLSQIITVHPGIIADFDFTSVPCTGQFVFDDQSATAPVFWDWDFDDGGHSSTQNPTHTFPSTGSYNVQLITATINGCSDTTDMLISYTNVTTFASPDDTICISSIAGSQLNAGGGFAYSWSPAGSLNASNIPNPVAHPLVNTTYTVSISTINSLGDTCVQTQTVTVSVLDPSIYPLTVTADVDSILEGGSTVLHAITDTNFVVNWTPVGGLNDPHSHNPVATPLETTTYTASILDSAGCPKQVSITIYVQSNQCKTQDVFVPNTFTPNGDGQNDILFVRSNVVQELYFAVYNRWGEMVYETSDMTKGWNGIYKGMKSDPAVFAWYLRAKCFNGDEIKMKGNTTLIR